MHYRVQCSQENSRQNSRQYSHGRSRVVTHAHRAVCCVSTHGVLGFAAHHSSRRSTGLEIVGEFTVKLRQAHEEEHGTGVVGDATRCRGGDAVPRRWSEEEWAGVTRTHTREQANKHANKQANKPAAIDAACGAAAAERRRRAGVPAANAARRVDEAIDDA